MILCVMFSTCQAAKTWTPGSAIETPSITSPGVNKYYGFHTVVVCKCDEVTDEDHWVDPSETPCEDDEPDFTITYKWSDGGAGGSFKGGIDDEREVTYITPNNAGDVTLTVTCNDNPTLQDRDDVTPSYQSRTIHVYNAKMVFKVDGSTTDHVTRVEDGTFEVLDGSNNTLSYATYSNWSFAGKVNVSDSSVTSSSWSGPIVQSGKAQCTVTIRGSTEVTVQSEEVEADARTGNDWVTPCQLDAADEDCDSTWGDFPKEGENTAMGRNRDKATDDPDLVQPRGDLFNTGFSLGAPISGPNKGVYFVMSCSFHVTRETVVSKHLRNGTVWYDYNVSQGADLTGIVTGVKNHEARGSGTGSSGHQKMLEDSITSAANDPRKRVEGLVAASGETLEGKVYTEFIEADNNLTADTNPGPSGEPSGNWGPEDLYIHNSFGQWHTIVADWGC